MCWFSSFIHFILVSVAAVDLATRRAAASKKPTKRNPKLWFSDNWPKLEFNTGKQGWLNKIMFFLPNINHTQAAERDENAIFYSWWPSRLTFDLDLQTHPSEGPIRPSGEFGANSFSVQCPRYFLRKQKTHRLTAPKTFCSWLHAVKSSSN